MSTVVNSNAPSESSNPDLVENAIVLTTKDLSVFYGDFRAVRDVSLYVKRGEITAFIGPSGCGKSTVLRCFNRMNDLIPNARIEDLMQEIKQKYTIVIVTHNMQQAGRVSDRTAFVNIEVNTASDRNTGVLVEFNTTQKLFSRPDDERTEAYITGRFG
jgi:ABC-type phosphate transport system ATPase subunit